MYDAFIAYSQPGYAWVRDHLELEQGSGISLCLHNRDVMEAVHGSRKVIMVLSSTFLDSEWCELDLEVAQMRSFDERREPIIPIVLKDLPVHKMSRNMRHLLRRNAYRKSHIESSIVSVVKWSLHTIAAAFLVLFL